MEKNVSLHKCYGYPIVNPRYLLTDSFTTTKRYLRDRRFRGQKESIAGYQKGSHTLIYMGEL